MVNILVLFTSETSVQKWKPKQKTGQISL